ncbi:NF-kappa-B inhibitor cactus-like [Microplitis mediator]|uniref:NF-kappa-B inhibitor cactus-like n=1 Tax=Microplitis mediator TaxID=375433 RepID=UPI002553FCBD|nr:NF-kappa-B inhibitor cactus-like [Microplitis mediator]
MGVLDLLVLLKINWRAHFAYSGENVFHVIVKNGWYCSLCELQHLLDDKFTTRLNQKNDLGQTCLHVAVRIHRGQRAIKMIEKLVKYGTDLNVRERNSSDTVLHIAVGNQDYELAAWLCQQPHIDLEAENYYSHMAFKKASKNKDKEMAIILKTYGTIPRQDFLATAKKVFLISG